jgi:signal transduction histidine kinase
VHRSVLAPLLLLLVLAPSAALAVLGYRAIDAFDASDASRLRRDVEEARAHLEARAPALRAAVEARVRHALAACAATLVRDLPGLDPRAAARRLHRAQARLGDPVGVRRLAVLDAAGRRVLPAALVPDDAPPDPRSGARAALLEDLRARADRARYGPGGRAAALAVWQQAGARFRDPSLKALAAAEAARLRARGGGAAAAAREAGALEAHWPPRALAAAARPLLLLWMAAAPAGPAWRARLERALQDGLADATPLTGPERAHLRALAGRPAEGPAVLFHADLAGGARLEAEVPAAALRDLLADALARDGALPAGVRVRVVSRAPREAGRGDRFARAARGRLAVALPGSSRAVLVLRHRREASARAAGGRRRLWMGLGVLALFLVSTAGLLLTIRAARREREARRLRDEFIANVTHEVRTPLTSVLLHAELLADERTGAQARRDHAAVVEAQGRRLAALVDDMLDFEALEHGRRALEASPVDLAAACRDAVAPYAVLAEREGVALDVRAQDGAVPALADPAALARILANLVANAWKHGRPSRDGHPGRLRVEARAEASRGVVEVSDDGPGIPASERARVFERFGRGRAAARREGSGIGLALGRDLARAQGGDLGVVAEDGRTVFRLTLPPVPLSEDESCPAGS